MLEGGHWNWKLLQRVLSVQVNPNTLDLSDLQVGSTAGAGSPVQKPSRLGLFDSKKLW